MANLHQAVKDSAPESLTESEINNIVNTVCSFIGRQMDTISSASSMFWYEGKYTKEFHDGICFALKQVSERASIPLANHKGPST